MFLIGNWCEIYQHKLLKIVGLLNLKTEINIQTQYLKTKFVCSEGIFS